MSAVDDDDFLDNFDVTTPDTINPEELFDGTVVIIRRRDRIIIQPADGEPVRLLVLRIYVVGVDFVTVIYITQNPGGGGTTRNEQDIPVNDENGEVARMDIPDDGIDRIVEVIIRVRPVRRQRTATVSDLFLRFCLKPDVTTQPIESTTTPGE